jgi:hypothetical protein
MHAEAAGWAWLRSACAGRYVQRMVHVRLVYGRMLHAIVHACGCSEQLDAQPTAFWESPPEVPYPAYVPEYPAPTSPN